MDGVKTGTGNIAALIEDDNGQTVRLPEEYRLDAKEVRIRREGEALVLEPVVAEPEDKLGAWLKLIEETGAFDDDFVEAALDRPKDFGPGRRNDDINLD